MHKHLRSTASKWAVAALLPFLMLTGCQSKWEPNLITDVNNLGGRAVGVNLTWDADYILTPRKDLQLFRYDSLADMMMALGYDKVDAIAIDDMSWVLIGKHSTGLVKIEPEIKKTGYTWFFRDKELCDQFNEFLAEFKKTDDYADFREREINFDDNYEQPEIKLTGKGRTLRIAFDPDNYPRAFLEPGDTELYGFDAEPLKRFANAYDYQLEFIATNGNDAYMGVQNGNYDAGGGYHSLEYAEETEALGLYTSDPMDEASVFFVQKTQQDISVDIDKLE